MYWGCPGRYSDRKSSTVPRGGRSSAPLTATRSLGWGRIRLRLLMYFFASGTRRTCRSR